MNISCLFLQEFDTELDYTNEIRYVYLGCVNYYNILIAN